MPTPAEVIKATSTASSFCTLHLLAINSGLITHRIANDTVFIDIATPDGARFTLSAIGGHGLPLADQAEELHRIAAKLTAIAYEVEAACETDDVAQVSAALDGGQ